MLASEICQKVKAAIEPAIPDAQVSVDGAEGHFQIQVISEAFAGKRILEQQRMVYTAITPLMSGNDAPVHAVDQLVTRVP